MSVSENALFPPARSQRLDSAGPCRAYLRQHSGELHLWRVSRQASLRGQRQDHGLPRRQVFDPVGSGEHTIAKRLELANKRNHALVVRWGCGALLLIGSGWVFALRDGLLNRIVRIA